MFRPRSRFFGKVQAEHEDDDEDDFQKKRRTATRLIVARTATWRLPGQSVHHKSLAARFCGTL